MITDLGFCSFCSEYRSLDKAKRERHGYYCPVCTQGLIYIIQEDYNFTIIQDVKTEFGPNSWLFDDEDDVRETLAVIEKLLLGKPRRRAK